MFHGCWWQLKVQKKKSIYNITSSNSYVAGADKNAAYNFEIIFLLLA